MSQIHENDGKLRELGYELFPHPPNSSDLAPTDIFLFADLKKFNTNEDVIAETEGLFWG